WCSRRSPRLDSREDRCGRHAGDVLAKAAAACGGSTFDRFPPTKPVLGPATVVPNRSDSSDWRSSSATNEQGIELRRGSSPSEWQSAALARRAEATTAVVTPPQHWKDVEWQQLWLATQRRRWRSLALVPAGEMPPDFTLDIAVGLVQTGSLHLGMPIRVADATQVPLAHLMQFTSELDAVVAAGDL